MDAVIGGLRAGGRSRAIALPLVAVVLVSALGLAVLAYRGLAASGAFAVERIAVSGSRDQAEAVRAAARRSAGDASLLAVDPDAVALAVAALPGISSATVDRSFPSTLAIRVVAERPVALVPTGHGAVLVSATGRVMGAARGRGAGLPVLAAAPSDVPGVGGVLRGEGLREEVRVAAADWRGLRVTAVARTADGLVARLESGAQVRLGDASAIDRKLRVARAVLRRAADQRVRYLDVSVPDAPALRMETEDPLTADAPPAPAPPVKAQRTGGAGAADTPAESARAVFG